MDWRYQSDTTARMLYKLYNIQSQNEQQMQVPIPILGAKVTYKEKMYSILQLGKGPAIAS